MKNVRRIPKLSVTMTMRDENPALGHGLNGIEYSCGELIPLGWRAFRVLLPIHRGRRAAAGATRRDQVVHDPGWQVLQVYLYTGKRGPPQGFLLGQILILMTDREIQG